MYPRGDMLTKKNKIIIDGQKLKEAEFATEIVGTMGALASMNLYSMGSLTTMLEQKDQMIAQLQGQLKETKRNIIWEIKKGLEQARLNDIQEIQKMKASLEEANHKIQVTQKKVIKQEEINKELQGKINSISNQVVELEILQAQVLEIHMKIEREQHGVFFNLEFV
jgi:hypothetical protein